MNRKLVFLFVTLVLSSIRVVLETWLRMILSLDRLKNVTPTYRFDPAKECAMRSAEQAGATPIQWTGRTQHTCARAQQAQV